MKTHPSSSLIKYGIPILLCVLAVGVYLRRDHTTGLQASKTASVMLPWSISPEFAFLYTDDKPLSKSASVSISFEPTKGSFEVVQAFGLGKTDFGFLSSDGLASARQKGLPIKALFVLYRRTPAVVVALKGSGIKEPKDLLGKRVGVIKASATYPQFLSVMKNAGCPVVAEGEGKNITLDDAINGGVLQLKTRQIDALTSFANFAPVQLESSGEAIESPIEFSKYGIDIYGTVFAASEKIISDDPATVQAVVTMLLSRLNEAVENSTLAAKRYGERQNAVQTTPELLNATIAKTRSLVVPVGNNESVGAMSSEGWRQTIDTLVKTGQVQEINSSNCFDDRFYLQALKSLAEPSK